LLKPNLLYSKAIADLNSSKTKQSQKQNEHRVAVDHLKNMKSQEDKARTEKKKLRKIVVKKRKN